MNYSHYLKKLIETARTYGITVGYGGLPNPERPTPVRGAFRAAEIRLPKDNDEEALFILLHGIGHIAQWTLCPEEQDVSYQYQNKIDSWTQEELQALLKHELDALPFSLGFLEQNNASKLSEWYRRYFFADQEYIADVFKQNHYQPDLFRRVLGQVRRYLPSQVKKIDSRSFPATLTKSGREDFIHVI